MAGDASWWYSHNVREKENDMKIRKQDPRRYKTITIGTQTYIMDEKMALDLMRTMSEEFNWASWVITQDDLLEEIQSWMLEPFNRDVAHEIARQVSDTKAWQEGASEQMMIEGLACVREEIKSYLKGN